MRNSGKDAQGHTEEGREQGSLQAASWSARGMFCPLGCAALGPQPGPGAVPMFARRRQQGAIEKQATDMRMLRQGHQGPANVAQ